MFSINKYFSEILTLIMAFIVACGLWYVVVGNAHLENMLNIPLEFRNLPKNFILVNNNANSIDVQILASSELYASLKNRNLSYRVDLSNVKDGANVVPVDIHLVLDGVDITKISPEHIVVEVDTITKKSIPIHVDFSLNDREDLEISNVIIAPASITIEGPSSLLNEMEFLKVPFDINNVDGEGFYSRNLQLIAPKGLSLSVPVTTLSFDVITEKTVIEVNKPIISNNLPNGFKIKPKSTVLNLEVPAGKVIDNVLDPALNSQIQVSVTGFNGVTEGTRLSVQINLPKTVKIIDINPSTISVVKENKRLK